MYIYLFATITDLIHTIPRLNSAVFIAGIAVMPWQRNVLFIYKMETGQSQLQLKLDLIQFAPDTDDSCKQLVLTQSRLISTLCSTLAALGFINRGTWLSLKRNSLDTSP